MQVGPLVILVSYLIGQGVILVAFFFQITHLKYASWLQHRLENVRQGVAENLKDARQDMKEGYDRRHKVEEETWKVGQKVLLLDKRVNPGATRVLTHQPYTGPFLSLSVYREIRLDWLIS